MAERMQRVCFAIPHRMAVEFRRLSQFEGRSQGEIVRAMIDTRIQAHKTVMVDPGVAARNGKVCR